MINGRGVTAVTIQDNLGTNTHLRDFVIQSANIGIQVSANASDIRNITIVNPTGPYGVTVMNASGPSQDHSIHNVTVTRADTGVFIDPATNVTVRNVTVRDSRVGIHAEGTDAVHSRFINVTNVTINNSAETGILLDFVDDVNVSNSTIANLSRSPVTDASDNATAIRARGPGNNLNITGLNVTNVSCIGNFACGSIGIDINGADPNGTVEGPATNITLRGNRIADQFGLASLGIIVQNAYGFQIENNTVSNLSTALLAPGPGSGGGGGGGAPLCCFLNLAFLGDIASGIAAVEPQGTRPANTPSSAVRNNTLSLIGSLPAASTGGSVNTAQFSFFTFALVAGGLGDLPVRVSDNRVEGSRGVIALGVVAGPNSTYGPNNAVNNTTGLLGAGIASIGSSNFTVRGNTVSNTSGLFAAGIGFTTSGAPATGITIENNTVSDGVGNLSVGIGFVEGDNITVRNNIINRNRGGVAVGVGVINGSDSTVSGNTVTGNTGDPGLPVQSFLPEFLPVLPVDLNGTGLGVGGINVTSSAFLSNDVSQNVGNLSASLAFLGSAGNDISRNSVRRSLGNVSLGVGLALNSSGNTVENNSVSDNAGNLAFGVGVFESPNNTLRSNTLLRSAGNALRSIGSVPPLLQDAADLMGKEVGAGVAVLNATNTTVAGDNASDNAGARAAFGVVAVNATILRVNDTAALRNAGPLAVGVAALESSDVALSNVSARQNVNSTAAAERSDPPLDLGPGPSLPLGLPILRDRDAQGIIVNLSRNYLDGLGALGRAPWLNVGTVPVTDRIEADFPAGTSAGVMVRNVTGARVDNSRAFSDGKFGFLFNNSTNPPGVPATAYLNNSVSCFNQVDFRNDTGGPSLPALGLQGSGNAFDDSYSLPSAYAQMGFKSGDCTPYTLSFFMAGLNLSAVSTPPPGRWVSDSGTVISPGNRPLAGVSVVAQILDSGGQVLAVYNTTTRGAPLGSFSMSLLAPGVAGSYTVRTVAKYETVVNGQTVLEVGARTDSLTVSGPAPPSPLKLTATVQTDRSLYFPDQRVYFTGFVTDRATGAPVVADVTITVTEFINATTTTTTTVTTASSIAGWYFNDTYFTPTSQFTYTAFASAVSGGANSDPAATFTVGTLPTSASARIAPVGGNATLTVSVTNAGDAAESGLRAVAFTPSATLGQTSLPDLAPGDTATVAIQGPHGLPEGDYTLQVRILDSRNELQGGGFADLTVGQPRTLKEQALSLLQRARALAPNATLDAAVAAVNASLAGPWLDSGNLSWPAGRAVLGEERDAAQSITDLLNDTSTSDFVRSLLSSALERLVAADDFLATSIASAAQALNGTAREAIGEVNDTLAQPALLRKTVAEPFDDASRLASLSNVVTSNGALQLAPVQAWTKYAGNPVLSPTPSAQDIDSVGSPSVLFINGSYRMWYVGFGCFPGCVSSIVHATSPDGVNWSKTGTVLLPSGFGSAAQDQSDLSGPTVLFDGSRFRMWYSAFGCAPDFSSCADQIFTATSPDGTNWTKRPGPVLSPTPAAFDSYDVRSPAVLFDGARFQMWYTGNYGQGIGHATSPDGVNWTKDPANPVLVPDPSSWDSYNVNGSTVLFDGSVYRMWYTGNYGQGIGHATSLDGVHWAKTGSPVLSPGPGWDQQSVGDPSVLPVNGSFRMWYGGYSCPAYPCTYGIGEASSPDGVNWVKNSANPVLTPTPVSQVPFDAAGAGFAQVLFDGTRNRMWYTGQGPQGSAIGLATSPDGVNWTKAGRVLAGGEAVPAVANFTDPQDCAGCYVDIKDVSLTLGLQFGSPYLTANITTYPPAFEGSYYWCVYVDTDRNPSTGYRIGDIGADTSTCNTVGSPITLYTGSTDVDVVVASSDLQDLAPDTGHVSLDFVVPWDEQGVAAPAVLYDSRDGLYKMWYSSAQFFGPGIGYATSPDGVHWTKDPANPVLTPTPVLPVSANFTDPQDCAGCALDIRDVNLTLSQGQSNPNYVTLTANVTAYSSLQYYDTWCVYVDADRNPSTGTPVADIGADASNCGQLGSPVTLQVYSPGQSVDVVVVGGASSPQDFAPDSGHATLALSRAWDSAAVGLATVVIDGGVFKMWYTGGNPGAQEPLEIGLATSTDGVHWTKEPANPVLAARPGTWDAFVAAPYVTTARGTFEMWYTGITSFGGPAQFGIGYATSSDGVHWTRPLPAPVLGPGPQGAWDAGFTALPSVVSVMANGTLLRMWYTGAATSNPQNAQIGLAESPVFASSGYAASVPVDEGFTLRMATANWTADVPNGTGLAVALSADGGATFEPVSSGVPHLFASPGRSLEFRADLSGNGRRTPSLYDLSVAYVPLESKLITLREQVGGLVVSPLVRDHLTALLDNASANLDGALANRTAGNASGVAASLAAMRENLEDLVNEEFLGQAIANLTEGRAAGETAGAVSLFGNAWNLAHLALVGDITPPTVRILSPVNGSVFLSNQTVTVLFTATDNESGVATVSATLDGSPVFNGTVVDLRFLALGNHTVVVTATDRAGNVGTANSTFTVLPLPASLEVDPVTLQLKSRGQSITAFIAIPWQNLSLVNLGTVQLVLPGGTVAAEPSPSALTGRGGVPSLMVQFNRTAVEAFVPPGNVTFTVTGRVNGAIFQGSDTVRVIG